jgi:hypothetical protein
LDNGLHAIAPSSYLTLPKLAAALKLAAEIRCRLWNKMFQKHHDRSWDKDSSNIMQRMDDGGIGYMTPSLITADKNSDSDGKKILETLHNLSKYQECSGMLVRTELSGFKSI